MFLLLAGWCILIAALVLFGPVPMRQIFLILGLCTQALGLVMAFRAEPRLKGRP